MLKLWIASRSGFQERHLDTLPRGDALFAKGVELPEKDWPILLAAMAGNCTHLITGDKKHFGAHFGNEVSGVMIELPAQYLRDHDDQRGA